MQKVEFDQYAQAYQSLVDDSIRTSGESACYFAEQRLRCLKRLLDQIGIDPATVLDYGCGVGLAAPLFRDVLQATRVRGIDISSDSIEVARQRPIVGVSFDSVTDYRPTGDTDLCCSSSVFHHIVPADRPAAMGVIRDSLRPGGLMALFEHNPLNPGTRWVMHSCVFDKDAQTLSARVGRAMLRAHGFEILLTRYLFIFPRSLRLLRFLERPLASMPLGAQYLVLARKI